MVVVILGREVEISDVAYYTYNLDKKEVIIGRRVEFGGELHFWDVQEDDGTLAIKTLSEAIPDARRFDFDGWFFQKRHLINWSISDFGRCEFDTVAGLVIVNIKMDAVENARNFLNEEF